MGEATMCAVPPSQRRHVQRRPHTRQAADLLAKATNGLAITRRHAATGVAVQWALLGIGSRLGAEGLSFCGVDQRVGLPAWAMNLAFRRDAGERPRRGAYGGRSRLCRRAV